MTFVRRFIIILIAWSAGFLALFLLGITLGGYWYVFIKGFSLWS